MAFFCPICGAPEAQRERRPNGNSRCDEGHPYASAAAIDEPTKLYVVLDHAPDALRKYARPEGGLWVVGKSPEAKDGRPVTHTLDLTPGRQGPLAIAVPNHMMAEVLGDLVGGLSGPNDQGVRVIPFGASALSAAGAGALLYRALIVVAPRDGPISAIQFDSWVQQSIVPYLVPNAPRVSL
jgi:hypothetical protein